MDWTGLLNQIIEVCVIPLLGVLTTYLVMFLNAKKEELKIKTDNELAQKYIDMLTDTITTCVIATNQTYVDSLKKQGKFDAAAQEEAFQKTLDAVLSILSDEAQTYLANLYGDLSAYILQLIEAQVNQNK